MTDRHAGYIVTMGEDIREDDAESIITAMRMIKGVISVEPIVSDLALHMATERANREWTNKLYNLINVK